MSPDDLRAQIREELPDGIREMCGIMRSDKSSDKSKIEAFKTLADRGGIPEIKATVTEVVTTKRTIDDLQTQRQDLLQEQDSIAFELRQLKAGGLEDAKLRQASILPQPPKQKGNPRD